MNRELMNKCDLLAKNRDTIQKAFMWDGYDMLTAGSSLYVGANQEVDLEKLKECKKILNANAGVFSEYQGNVRMPLLCKMALSEDPEKYLNGIKNLVTLLRAVKWVDPEYKVLTAMTIYDHTKPEDYEAAIEKTAVLYKKMSKNHPWITSWEDVPFAAMLAVSGIDTDELLSEMENCYQALKGKFFDKNAVQSLSHVMAIDKTETSEKCRKVEQIWDLLKEKQHRFGTNQELAVLGTVCSLDEPAEIIAEEIMEADDYLKTKKGFGSLLFGDYKRRMYAALMVMNTHMPEGSLAQESMMDSLLTMIITMEICMIIMMTTMCVTTCSH